MGFDTIEINLVVRLGLFYNFIDYVPRKPETFIGHILYRIELLSTFPICHKLLRYWYTVGRNIQTPFLLKPFVPDNYCLCCDYILHHLRGWFRTKNVPNCGKSSKRVEGVSDKIKKVYISNVDSLWLRGGGV